MTASTGRGKIEIRRNKILDILKQNGKVSIAEISEKMDVSLVTARKDIDVLADRGMLLRVNGGAVLLSPESDPEGTRIANLDLKRDIATRAAKLINDGDTLFINSGSTMELFAQELRHKRGLNIVTNSINVATELGAIPSFRVILLGGTIDPIYKFTYGADTQDHLRRFAADRAILSIDGISPDGQITTCHAEEAIIDRIMIARARQVIILADKTKVGRTGFSYVGICDEKIKILTNE